MSDRLRSEDDELLERGRLFGTLRLAVEALLPAGKLPPGISPYDRDNRVRAWLREEKLRVPSVRTFSRFWVAWREVYPNRVGPW